MADHGEGPYSAIRTSSQLQNTGERSGLQGILLSSSCVGEQMYVEKNLIHLPTAEVNKVFSLNDEHMIIKYFAEPLVYYRSLIDWVKQCRLTTG